MDRIDFLQKDISNYNEELKDIINDMSFWTNVFTMAIDMYCDDKKVRTKLRNLFYSIGKDYPLFIKEHIAKNLTDYIDDNYSVMNYNFDYKKIDSYRFKDREYGERVIGKVERIYTSASLKNVVSEYLGCFVKYKDVLEQIKDTKKELRKEELARKMGINHDNDEKNQKKRPIINIDNIYDFKERIDALKERRDKKKRTSIATSEPSEEQPNRDEFDSSLGYPRYDSYQDDIGLPPSSLEDKKRKEKFVSSSSYLDDDSYLANQSGDKLGLLSKQIQKMLEYYNDGFVSDKMFLLSREGISWQASMLLKLGMVTFDCCVNYLDIVSRRSNYSTKLIVDEYSLNDLFDIYISAYKKFFRHSFKMREYAIGRLSNIEILQYQQKFGLNSFDILNPDELKEKVNQAMLKKLQEDNPNFYDDYAYKKIYMRIATATQLSSEKDLFSLCNAYLDKYNNIQDQRIIIKLFSDIIARRRSKANADEEEINIEKEKVANELIEMRKDGQYGRNQHLFQQAATAAQERLFGLSYVDRTIKYANDYKTFLDILVKSRQANNDDQTLIDLTETMNNLFNGR